MILQGIVICTDGGTATERYCVCYEDGGRIVQYTVICTDRGIATERYCVWYEDGGRIVQGHCVSLFREQASSFDIRYRHVAQVYYFLEDFLF
jgi:hypothetical protein